MWRQLSITIIWMYLSKMAICLRRYLFGNVFLTLWALKDGNSDCFCMNSTSKSETKDVLFRTLHYIKEKRIIDFTSLTVLLNFAKCEQGIFCDDLLDYLLLGENSLPFSVLVLKNGTSDFNLSDKLNVLLQNQSKSLILIDDCINHFVIETISTSFQQSMFRNHYWMFLNRYKYEENFTEILFDELSTNIHFDSQIYLLSGDSEIGYLSEVYRKCPIKPLTISHIATIGDTNHELNYIEFIWSRRKNIKGCPLRVAYLHDPPFIFELNSTQSDASSNDCLFQDGKTICGSYVELFRVIQDQLKFNSFLSKTFDTLIVRIVLFC